jgi:hypothetical protein
MTQLEDAQNYLDAVNELRNHLWVLHGALELQESFVQRLERQADGPADCRCAELVFATIDGEGAVCKACHDRWMDSQPYTYRKPNHLMGR